MIGERNLTLPWASTADYIDLGIAASRWLMPEQLNRRMIYTVSEYSRTYLPEISKNTTFYLLEATRGNTLVQNEHRYHGLPDNLTRGCLRSLHAAPFPSLLSISRIIVTSR